MGFLDKRRSKLPPATVRAMQEETRRQIAVAVSMAKQQARAEAQAEVLEALAKVQAKAVDA